MAQLDLLPALERLICRGPWERVSENMVQEHRQRAVRIQFGARDLPDWSKGRLMSTESNGWMLMMNADVCSCSFLLVRLCVHE